jgi:hypothetical protein
MVFGKGGAFGGGPDQHHFVVAGGRSVFKERPLRFGFRIVGGERRLPPPAAMDFRYRKAMAGEFFFLRGAAIRGNRHFR